MKFLSQVPKISKIQKNELKQANQQQKRMRN